jgi:predicted  nucleic acid-binding Zn-ribbon protein
MYHPQVDAISPTGPEASGERDDLKAIKEDLLKKITKVDREILKAESQIAKLKKKQQELEDATNKPLSDSNEEIERPKNQSVAQVIYAENRVSFYNIYKVSKKHFEIGFLISVSP